MENKRRILSIIKGYISKLRQLAQIRKNQKAIKLLDGWLNEPSSYDQEVWPKVKTSIEEGRKDRSEYSEIEIIREDATGVSSRFKAEIKLIKQDLI